MALNAAQMGTWDWNIGEDTATWSDETKRIFGRSPGDAEVTNEAFYALIHPDDRLRVQRAIERAIRHVSSYEAEYRMAMPDGKIRWVRGKGKVVCDEQGKPQRMIGINADITEQKQAQEDLQLSEMRRARAEAISLVMLTQVGLDGRWLKVPSTLCDLLGYTEKELLASNIKDVTHPDDLDNDLRECEQLTRGEIKSYGVEKRFFHKHGHTIWVYNNWSIVEDDLGKPLHFLTYIRDVTDRKLAELALYESNERNKAILRALPDLMFLQTREGVYLDYYAKDIRDLLVPPESFLGKNIQEVMPPDLAEKVQACIARLKDHEDTEILEYSLPFGSEERHFEARMVIAEGDKVLSIVRDVTQPYRYADDLRKSQEQLLIRNRETRELALRLMTAQESERRQTAKTRSAKNGQGKGKSGSFAQQRAGVGRADRRVLRTRKKK